MIIWDSKDDSDNQIELIKYDASNEYGVDYELVVFYENEHHAGGGNSVAIKLDRKQLKDLFHVLGDELRAL